MSYRYILIIDIFSWCFYTNQLICPIIQQHSGYQCAEHMLPQLHNYHLRYVPIFHSLSDIIFIALQIKRCRAIWQTYWQIVYLMPIQISFVIIFLSKRNYSDLESNHRLLHIKWCDLLLQCHDDRMCIIIKSINFRSNDSVIERQEKQITHLRVYIGENEKVPKSDEIWRRERDALKNQLKVRHTFF